MQQPTPTDADTRTGDPMDAIRRAAQIRNRDVRDVLIVADEMYAVVSPDFDAYVTGATTSPRCALCTTSPCSCPPFGTEEYFALLRRVHEGGHA